MNVIVNRAEMHITNVQKVTLITYSLGSCIGVTLFDPVVGIGGLLHFLLPDSQIDTQRAQANPWIFADTGIPLFIDQASRLGADKDRWSIKVVGGAQMLDDPIDFRLGKRNYLALQKIFSLSNLRITAEDVGGNVNRTLAVEISSGKVWVKTSGGGTAEL
jgi:chemotaxis protein CheD